MKSLLPAQSPQAAPQESVGQTFLSASAGRHECLPHALSQPSWLQRLARDAVFRRLSAMKIGCIEIVEGAQRHRFGEPPSATSAKEIPAMLVQSPRLFTRTALNGVLGAAESYMAGEWNCNDLTGLIRVFIQNLEATFGLERGWARLSKPLKQFGHWLRRNTERGSRKNIAAHYDLSNDFFELFLDETMMYSSAFFERQDMPLAEASAAKNERLCAMLRLTPSDHLLEIGTGWGGFAIHAAGKFGCRVTTTTISKEQHVRACERVAKAGLSSRVTVLLEDYRSLRGQYDKIVSIEMIEAVGEHFLDTFFERCGELLRPHGAMALQAITAQDRFFKRHAANVDFIKKHIFPGSCLPSVARMLDATRARTNLSLIRLDDITAHYERTLRAWRERFFEKIELVRGMDFGEEFIRMWEFYLCYCEAGFAERYIGTVQMLFAKPNFKFQVAAS